jgi:glycosyltransferase involved in cell wall biosynthesis
MNVIFLSELFPPHGSGGQLATYLYARLLSEEGFNVKVVTNQFPNEPAISKNEGFTIYRLPMFKEGSSLKFSTLHRADVLFSSFMQKTLNWADVVYVPMRWYSAIPMAKLLKKPVVMHLHDYALICPLSTLYGDSRLDLCLAKGRCSLSCVYRAEIKQRNLKASVASTLLNATVNPFLTKIAGGYSDAIVCVSKEQRDILLKADPSFTSKTSVVYNPLPDFENVPLKGNDFGYFGGLSYVKGFRTLYKSATSLKDSSSKPLRIHCTKFDHVNKNFAASAASSGFSLYGKVDKQKYNSIYENVSVVIVPSLWPEPWPYVVVEALLCGRYIVASKIGGIPEQLNACKGVSLIQAGDVEELAEAMSDVHALKKEAILALGSQNRETFSKRFSNKASLTQFIKVLEAVV